MDIYEIHKLTRIRVMLDQLVRARHVTHDWLEEFNTDLDSVPNEMLEQDKFSRQQVLEYLEAKRQQVFTEVSI